MIILTSEDFETIPKGQHLMLKTYTMGKHFEKKVENAGYLHFLLCP